MGTIRVGIDIIKKASAVVFVEDARKAPWLLLKRLHVLYFNYEDIAWLCGFYLERTAQVMDLRQIDILHVVRAIVVSNLSSSPINAFYLDDLAVLDGAGEGDWSRNK